MFIYHLIFYIFVYNVFVTKLRTLIAHTLLNKLHGNHVYIISMLPFKLLGLRSDITAYRL